MISFVVLLGVPIRGLLIWYLVILIVLCNTRPGSIHALEVCLNYLMARTEFRMEATRSQGHHRQEYAVNREK